MLFLVYKCYNFLQTYSNSDEYEFYNLINTIKL